MARKEEPHPVASTADLETRRVGREDEADIRECPRGRFHLPTWMPSPSPFADDPIYTYSLVLGAAARSLVAARVAVAAERNPRRVQHFITFSLVSSRAARR